MVAIPDKWYVNKALTALKLIWVLMPVFFAFAWIFNMTSFEWAVMTLLVWYYGDDTVVIERS